MKGVHLMGSVTLTGNANQRRLRLVERVQTWMEKPLAPLQLKATDMADRPLTAKGGRKVVIQTGDERIEYVAGTTKVEGRITPAAQDALEPKLEALGKERDQTAAAAIAELSAALALAKSVYDDVCAKARAKRDETILAATSAYEKAAREAILAASGGK